MIPQWCFIISFLSMIIDSIHSKETCGLEGITLMTSNLSDCKQAADYMTVKENLKKTPNEIWSICTENEFENNLNDCLSYCECTNDLLKHNFYNQFTIQVSFETDGKCLNYLQTQGCDPICDSEISSAMAGLNLWRTGDYSGALETLESAMIGNESLKEVCEYSSTYQDLVKRAATGSPTSSPITYSPTTATPTTDSPTSAAPSTASPSISSNPTASSNNINPPTGSPSQTDAPTLNPIQSTPNPSTSAPTAHQAAVTDNPSARPTFPPIPAPSTHQPSTYPPTANMSVLNTTYAPAKSPIEGAGDNPAQRLPTGTPYEVKDDSPSSYIPFFIVLVLILGCCVVVFWYRMKIPAGSRTNRAMMNDQMSGRGGHRAGGTKKSSAGSGRMLASAGLASSSASGEDSEDDPSENQDRHRKRRGKTHLESSSSGTDLEMTGIPPTHSQGGKTKGVSKFKAKMAEKLAKSKKKKEKKKPIVVVPMTHQTGHSSSRDHHKSGHHHHPHHRQHHRHRRSTPSDSSKFRIADSDESSDFLGFADEEDESQEDGGGGGENGRSRQTKKKRRDKRKNERMSQVKGNAHGPGSDESSEAGQVAEVMVNLDNVPSHHRPSTPRSKSASRKELLADERRNRRNAESDSDDENGDDYASLVIHG